MEYACPRCSKKILVIDAPNNHFKYKLQCFCCSFTEYTDTVENLKELQWEERKKQL